jgi:hypothetical protein
LSSGLLALSTGSAAVTAEARPREVPNQYQLLTVRPSGVTRHARQYVVGQRRWIEDTRVSANGSDWHQDESHPLADVHATFTSDRPDRDPRRDADRDPRHVPGDEFFDRVLEATLANHPGATVTPPSDAGYLRVSNPVPDGGAEQCGRRRAHRRAPAVLRVTPGMLGPSGSSPSEGAQILTTSRCGSRR